MATLSETLTNLPTGPIFTTGVNLKLKPLVPRAQCESRIKTETSTKSRPQASLIPVMTPSY